MLVQRTYFPAIALCLSLAACGGGGSSSDPSSTAAAAVDPTSVVNIQKHPASVSGTAIPPATSISDSSGAVWTLKSGVVYRASVAAGFTDQVTLLLWYAGVIYQENVNHQWWKWQNNGWVASSDPRPVVPPVVTPPVVTPPVVTPPVVTPPVVTPPVATSAIPFYGTNGHYVQGGYSLTVPLATQSASLADLGLKSFRQDMYSDSQIDTIASTVISGLGKGVQVLPLVIAYPWNDPAANGNPTEATAYAYAYGMAAHAATKFAGIPVVEFGNEYDLDGHNKALTNDGVNVSDYDNSTWPIWRGAMRGAYDGWRSVDTAGVTKIINTASAGYLHLGWYKGMLTGTQPDGSTGHPVVKTDIIQLHWYSDGGDFEAANNPSNGQVYNVLAQLKAAYNLPIMFTEIGVNMDFSAAQGQAYINKTIPELVAAKATYNVIGFNWYELFDDTNIGGDGNFGLMSNGTTKKSSYATMKSIIAATPVK
ncbi:beta-glucosidase [Caballeronia sp. LjRoot29]|uniref:beta-glucosidase n=1 Tax=Caballeronia sp. LjRoot29 TaxID=3342315 RepID=UPI003ED009B3